MVLVVSHRTAKRGITLSRGSAVTFLYRRFNIWNRGHMRHFAYFSRANHRKMPLRQLSASRQRAVEFSSSFSELFFVRACSGEGHQGEAGAIRMAVIVEG